MIVKNSTICKETMEHLNCVIDLLPDIIFAVDMNGKIVAWNKHMVAFTGKTREEVMGTETPYSTSFYGYRRKLLIDLVFTVDKESEDTYDKFCRKPDGSVEGYIYIPYLNKYLWGKASPILDANGKTVGAVESIRDITESVDARKMADLSTKLLDSVADMIWAKDINNRYLFANKCFKDTLELGDKNIKGMKTSELFAGEEKFELTDEMAKEKGPLSVIESITTHSGKLIWLKICKVPFFDEKSRLIGTIGNARDITNTHTENVALKEEIEKDLSSWKEEQAEIINRMRTTISNTVKMLKDYRESNGKSNKGSPDTMGSF
jgi:PAS domain S-box-containing protein